MGEKIKKFLKSFLGKIIIGIIVALIVAFIVRSCNTFSTLVQTVPVQTEILVEISQAPISILYRPWNEQQGGGGTSCFY